MKNRNKLLVVVLITIVGITTITSCNSINQSPKPEEMRQKIEGYLDQYYGEILTGPGWVHEMSNSSLPVNLVSGQNEPSPTVSMIEAWFFLDESEFVTKEVSFLSYKDQYNSQIFISKDGIRLNMTTGESLPLDPALLEPETMVFEFLDKLSEYYGNNQQLSQYMEVYEGVQVEVFEIITIYDPPVEKMGFQELLVSETHKIKFETETGKFNRQEWIYKMDDGDEYLEFDDTPIFESVDMPPDEILAYLEE